MSSTTIEVPVEMLTAFADLKFTPRTDQRLQKLMDGNNEGRLTPDEREQLEALVELSEQMSLARARALHILGRSPQ